MAPPPTSSHTSLPSQTGPMVLMSTRRSRSSLAIRPTSMPTPKSKPSSTKYPTNRTAIRMNQTVVSSMAVSSVRERQRGVGVVVVRRGRIGVGQPLADEHQQQLDLHDGERAVQQGE